MRTVARSPRQFVYLHSSVCPQVSISRAQGLSKCPIRPWARGGMQLEEGAAVLWFSFAPLPPPLLRPVPSPTDVGKTARDEELRLLISHFCCANRQVPGSGDGNGG